MDASSILGFGGGEPVSQLLPWVESYKSFSEELYRDVSRNDLKPTRLKRQITPRNLDRKESLPKYAKKAADGAQNSILVFFRRFFENYKLVDKSSSGNKDEQNSFDELSSSSGSLDLPFYSENNIGAKFSMFPNIFQWPTRNVGKSKKQNSKGIVKKQQ